MPGEGAAAILPTLLSEIRAAGDPTPPRLGALVAGAGAVLPEGLEVPPGSLVLGVPAKVVRPVDDALAARVRRTWEHYVVQARRHRAGTVRRHPWSGEERL